MKKIKRFVAMLLSIVMTFTMFTVYVNAASFGFTSHDDGDEIDPEKYIYFEWSSYSGASQYRFSLYNVSERKYIAQPDPITSLYYTVGLSEFFNQMGDKYKATIEALDTNGKVLDDDIIYLYAKEEEFEVDKDELEFSASGGYKYINISSEIEFTIHTENQLWLTTDKLSGKSDTKVKVTCSKNTSVNERKGCINIVSKDKSRELHVYVTQEAGKTEEPIETSKEELNFTAEGGTEKFVVYANSDYSVIEKADWLSLSSKAGSTQKTFTVTCDENTTYSSRTAYITVESDTDEDNYVEIEVYQEAKEKVIGKLSTNFERNQTIELDDGEEFSFKNYYVKTTAEEGLKAVQLSIVSATNSSHGIKYSNNQFNGSKQYYLTSVPNIKAGSTLSGYDQGGNPVTLSFDYNTSWKVTLHANDMDGNDFTPSGYSKTIKILPKAENLIPSTKGFKDTYELVLGEPLVLDGTVTAQNSGTLNKVTIKHIEDDSFSKSFDNINSNSFIIDEDNFDISYDRYPFNNIGDYDFGVFATASNFDGVERPELGDIDYCIHPFKVKVINSTVELEDFDSSKETLRADEEFKLEGTITTDTPLGLNNVTVKIFNEDSTYSYTLFKDTSYNGEKIQNLSSVKSVKIGDTYTFVNDAGSTKTITIKPDSTWNIVVYANDKNKSNLGEHGIKKVIYFDDVENIAPEVTGFSDTYEIVQGEPLILDGVVKAKNDGTLTKVTINHIKTSSYSKSFDKFTNNNTTLNISDFEISEDTYPINTVGEHTFGIFATASNYSGDKDGNCIFTFTVKVTEKEVENIAPDVTGFSDTYEIVQGEPLVLNGIIKAKNNGSLTKVTINHIKTSSYTKSFDSFTNNGTTLTLSDFEISEDEYPINTVGEHTFGIFATASNYSGDKDGNCIFTFTVKVTEKEVENIAPKVTGISNIYEIVQGDPLVIDGTVTTQNGGTLNKVTLRCVVNDKIKYTRSFEKSSFFNGGTQFNFDNFIIPATESPINEVGEYQFDIYATASNFDGVERPELNDKDNCIYSFTVKVVPKEISDSTITLSGFDLSDEELKIGETFNFEGVASTNFVEGLMKVELDIVDANSNGKIGIVHFNSDTNNSVVVSGKSSFDLSNIDSFTAGETLVGVNSDNQPVEIELKSGTELNLILWVKDKNNKHEKYEKTIAIIGNEIEESSISIFGFNTESEEIELGKSFEFTGMINTTSPDGLNHIRINLVNADNPSQGIIFFDRKDFTGEKSFDLSTLADIKAGEEIEGTDEDGHEVQLDISSDTRWAITIFASDNNGHNLNVKDGVSKIISVYCKHEKTKNTTYKTGTLTYVDNSGHFQTYRSDTICLKCNKTIQTTNISEKETHESNEIKRFGKYTNSYCKCGYMDTYLCSSNGNFLREYDWWDAYLINNKREKSLYYLLNSNNDGINDNKSYVDPTDHIWVIGENENYYFISYPIDSSTPQKYKHRYISKDLLSPTYPAIDYDYYILINSVNSANGASIESGEIYFFNNKCTYYNYKNSYNDTIIEKSGNDLNPSDLSFNIYNNSYFDIRLNTKDDITSDKMFYTTLDTELTYSNKGTEKSNDIYKISFTLESSHTNTNVIDSSIIINYRSEKGKREILIPITIYPNDFNNYTKNPNANFGLNNEGKYFKCTDSTIWKSEKYDEIMSFVKNHSGEEIDTTLLSNTGQAISHYVYLSPKDAETFAKAYKYMLEDDIRCEVILAILDIFAVDFGIKETNKILMKDLKHWPRTRIYTYLNLIYLRIAENVTNTEFKNYFLSAFGNANGELSDTEAVKNCLMMLIEVALSFVPEASITWTAVKTLISIAPKIGLRDTCIEIIQRAENGEGIFLIYYYSNVEKRYICKYIPYSGRYVFFEETTPSSDYNLSSPKCLKLVNGKSFKQFTGYLIDDKEMMLASLNLILNNEVNKGLDF